jgi:hypothetical protein
MLCIATSDVKKVAIARGTPQNRHRCTCADTYPRSVPVAPNRRRCHISNVANKVAAHECCRRHGRRGSPPQGFPRWTYHMGAYRVARGRMVVDNATRSARVADHADASRVFPSSRRDRLSICDGTARSLSSPTPRLARQRSLFRRLHLSVEAARTPQGRMLNDARRIISLAWSINEDFISQIRSRSRRSCA